MLECNIVFSGKWRTLHETHKYWSNMSRACHLAVDIVYVASEIYFDAIIAEIEVTDSMKQNPS
jgi:hypothetical protein